jgi:hypothetical protein
MRLTLLVVFLCSMACQASPARSVSPASETTGAPRSPETTDDDHVRVRSRSCAKWVPSARNKLISTGSDDAVDREVRLAAKRACCSGTIQGRLTLARPLPLQRDASMPLA